MNAGDVVIQLDKQLLPPSRQQLATSGHCAARSTASMTIHSLFKAQRASCKMTEAEYAEKATQLLDILGDFEGLIAELADAPSQ